MALLGCGVVGSSVARMLTQHADDLAARVGRRLELVGIAVRRAEARTAPTCPSTRRCSPPTPSAGRPGRHRHRGHRRHRAGPQPDPQGHEARRLGRERQQGAARRGRPQPVCRGRPSAASTSTTRPRSPARSRSCARSASPSPVTRSAGCSASSTAPPTTSSTRWTRPAMGFAEAVEQAQALGYAEADPTADVEGFDAAAKAAILASPRLPHPGLERGRLPRGHHRGERRRRPGRQGDGLRRQAARDLRAHRRRDRAATSASACACTRR